jgi:hypothetical protein
MVWSSWAGVNGKESRPEIGQTSKALGNFGAREEFPYFAHQK